MDTILLNPSNWDLLLDANGNIARASDPYANAQDVASACRLFLGELYYDTSKGIPYREQILGESPPIQVVASHLEAAALSVPGIVSARASLTFNSTERRIVGTIETINTAGQTNNVEFQ